jgi:Tol biopolymer transport system component
MGIHAGLAVSPEGTLAVPSGGTQAEGPPGIFLLPRTASGWRRLTSTEYGDYQPSFSPEGKELAFVRSTSLGREDLCVIPVNGGPLRELTYRT